MGYQSHPASAECLRVSPILPVYLERASKRLNMCLMCIGKCLLATPFELKYWRRQSEHRSWRQAVGCMWSGSALACCVTLGMPLTLSVFMFAKWGKGHLLCRTVMRIKRENGHKVPGSLSSEEFYLFNTEHLPRVGWAPSKDQTEVPFYALQGIGQLFSCQPPRRRLVKWDWELEAHF